MIIEENIKNTTFEEVNVGDVFRYGSIYYLKTPPVLSDDEFAYNYNSYDLRNNDFCFFSDHRDVIVPAKAKLIIE